MKVLHMLSTKQKEEWVLNEYDFYPEKIETLGSVKKVTCNQGIFALKKAKVSLGHFSFIVQCLHRLTEQHYPYILPLCRNKYGDYFVPIEGDAYYVTPWMEDKVEEKYLPQWEKILIEAMGQLHKKSLGVETNGNSAFSLTPPLLLRRWKQRVDDMEDLRNFAKSRDIMSPLEMTYVKHFEWLKEMATRAIRFLEEWDEKVPEGERRTVLCHGRFHRKNIIHTVDQVYIHHFEQATLDSPARDIALFYRRHGDKLLENEKVAYEWLEAYEQENPLLSSEKLLLSIYLLFPEGVFKEIEIYYQGKRDWSPLKKVRFFERQIQLMHFFRKFVKQMIEAKS